MKDNWSLKDKGIKTWESGNTKDTWISYNEKDIETLRQKLIDDFRNIAEDEDKDDVVYVETLLCEIIQMINKRFGVEE